MAFACAYVFLAINCVRIVADPIETFTFLDGLYSRGAFRLAALDAWLRAHVS